jgi:hypothetical protein
MTSLVRTARCSPVWGPDDKRLWGNDRERVVGEGERMRALAETAERVYRLSSVTNQEER